MGRSVPGPIRPTVKNYRRRRGTGISVLELVADAHGLAGRGSANDQAHRHPAQGFAGHLAAGGLDENAGSSWLIASTSSLLISRNSY